MKLHRLPPALVLAAALAACQPPEAVPPPTAEASPNGTFRAAVEAALPSVVFIQVEAVPHPGELPLPQGPLGLPDEPRMGAGSGVIISEAGYILTSDHVVQDADRVMVTLRDRRQMEAEVVARDPGTDIAVLRIEGNDLPVARIGDSDELALGDWVIALGSPLGLQFSVTTGVVSGKGRALGLLDPMAQNEGRAAPLEHFVQTDAAINPGNSGGPLVNVRGEVVGINAAIASPTGVFAGYGFAVPINLARRVAEQLLEHGHVRRAYLGVLLDEVSRADAVAYGLEAAEGAAVIHVQEGGPAAEAGVELGDVIIGIDDYEVETVNDLQAALLQLEPGSTARLKIVRFGKRVDAAVRLGVIRSGVRPEPPPSVEGPARVGFAIADEAGTVVITRVRPYSPAAHAGVRSGQVVLAVNRRPVASAAEFVEGVRASENDVVSMVVLDPAIGETIVNFELRP